MEGIERFVEPQDWITTLLLLVLLILVIVKQSYSQHFSQFIMLLVTDKYLLLKGKDPNIFHPFNLLLFLVNVITAGLFIFLFIAAYQEDPIVRPKVLFLRVITAYTTFVLLKFGLEKILANILALDHKLDYYLFYKLSYRNFLALLLLPMCILFIYAWEPNLVQLYIVLGIILFLNLVTLLGVYRKNQQFIIHNWFYFILYLCALEIGPYFILYKLITKL